MKAIDPQQLSAESKTNEILITEYHAAQSSAAHHVNLVWQATSILWAANIVLMGFVLSVIERPTMAYVVSAISIFGIVVSMLIFRFAWVYRGVALHKYGVCKEIEAKLGMRQHTTTPSSGLYRIYIIMTASLVSVWLLAMLYSLRG